jgi:hypothetical protein
MPTEKAPHQLLTRETTELGGILSFSSPEELNRVFDVMGWTFDEEVTRLVEIARNSQSDTARLMAIKALRMVRRECLEYSGLLQEIRQIASGPAGPASITLQRISKTLAPPISIPMFQPKEASNVPQLDEHRPPVVQ